MTVLLALIACKAPPTEPVGLCPELDEPTIDVSQGDIWGRDEGDPIDFGIPPQGGAPYAPFDIRLVGFPSSSEYVVTTDAFRASTGELLGEGEYNARFVCANVGENEGTRFAAEFHMRFFGFEPPEIAGEMVDVEITVTPTDHPTFMRSFTGPLDWVLGPMPE